MRILSFALALTVATQLVACSDNSAPTQVQQPVAVQPQVQQPQVVGVEQGGNDTSAGEAMLIGAAAGAVAGHLASGTSHTKTAVKTKYVKRPEKIKYVESSKFSASKSKVSTKKPVKLTKS